MKALILTCLLLLSFQVKAYDFLGTDFAPFPLSAQNITLIEGVWRGELIDIQITKLGTDPIGYPLMWVDISAHKENRVTSGILHYSEYTEQYMLYLFVKGRSFPVNIGMFQFGSDYANEQGMSCKSGGSLMQFIFDIEDDIGAVQLLKESCS